MTPLEDFWQRFEANGTKARMQHRLKTELPHEWAKIIGETPAPEPEDLFAQIGDDTEASSWAPADLTSILAGEYVPEVPVYLGRTDGIHLLYKGHVHSMHGESESSKSWIALAACVEVLNEGKRAAFLDFESDPATVVRRLLGMGATKKQLGEQFTYVRPDVSPKASEYAREDFKRLVQGNYALVIVDGTTDALGVFGMSGRDEDEVASFQRVLPKPFSKRGACVVLIDHVSKSHDERGRFAIGSQHKLAGLDGAAYVVEAKSAFGRGLRGESSIRVAKDRPGSVRPHGGQFRASDRTQEVARFILDETSGTMEWSITPPGGTDPATGEDKPWRPSARMEQLSREIEESPGVSVNKLSESTKVSKGNISECMDILEAEGYVRIEVGDRNSRRHFSVRPYRSGDDQKSPDYVWDLRTIGGDRDNDRDNSKSHDVDGTSLSTGTHQNEPVKPLDSGEKARPGHRDNDRDTGSFTSPMPSNDGHRDTGSPSLRGGPGVPVPVEAYEPISNDHIDDMLGGGQ